MSVLSDINLIGTGTGRAVMRPAVGLMSLAGHTGRNKVACSRMDLRSMWRVGG